MGEGREPERSEEALTELARESSQDSAGKTHEQGLFLHWDFGLLVAFWVGAAVSCSQDSLSVEDGWWLALTLTLGSGQ